MKEVLTTVLTVLTAMGGWEFVRWMLDRRSNLRKSDAEADGEEFKVLRETIDFLQVQLSEKEHRFADQTNMVRKLNEDVLDLTKKNAKLDLELDRYRCVRRGCKSREPENGY